MGAPRGIEITGYRIDGKIGEGGMAEVYRATQLSLDRPVAIKVVHFNGPQRDRLVSRFEHEARTIAKLDHPGIVGIFEVGRIGDDAGFYAMPLMPFGDLSARIGHLSQPEIADILVRLCEALDFAHAHGVVHRDIKPANVLFDREQRPRLADFGISRSPDIQGLTHEGDALGSARYMSPEQSRGQPVDGRSDLYSLGVLAFELLTGDAPYDEVDSMATALAHNTAPIPRLPAARAHWQKLIDRAMAKYPNERFPTGEAFAAGVRHAMASASRESGRIDVAAPTWWRPIPRFVIGFVVLAALFFGWRVLQEEDRDIRPPSLSEKASLPPDIRAAIDRDHWFTPESGSAAALIAAALAADRSADHLGAAQVLIDAAASAGLAAIERSNDREGVALLSKLDGFIALQALANVPATKRYHHQRDAVILERLEAAETAHNADLIDRLMPELAKSPHSARAQTLASRWRSGVLVGPPGRRLAMVRVDQRWVAIGVHEVSRADYQAFAEATNRTASECRQGGIVGLFGSRNWRAPGFDQASTHPVTCVSQADAKAYATWAGGRDALVYRLPTGPEWAAATRRAVATASPCSLGNLWDRFDDRPISLKDRHDCKDGFEHTAPVGQYRASADGIFDLIGNVSEWTRDGVFGTSYRSGARVDLAGEPDADTTGARSDVGFRLAMDVTP